MQARRRQTKAALRKENKERLSHRSTIRSGDRKRRNGRSGTGRGRRGPEQGLLDRAQTISGGLARAAVGHQFVGELLAFIQGCEA